MDSCRDQQQKENWIILNNHPKTTNGLRKIRKYLEINKNENIHTKTYGLQISSANRKICNCKGLYFKRRKTSNQQSNFMPQETRKKDKLKLKEAEGRK